MLTVALFLAAGAHYPRIAYSRALATGARSAGHAVSVATGGWADRASGAGGWGDAATSSQTEPDPSGDRWLSVRGCDVLLPESGEPRAIFHFVGGAFAGAAPRQLYGSFLEALSGFGFAVVATPCNLLHGLNHYAAAAEVAARWEAVSADLPALILPELMRTSGTAAAADALPPVIGLGHSLGAKLLVLLACGVTESPVGDAPGGELADGPLGVRVANVLVSYNNFPAARSVPMILQVNDVSTFARSGGAAAAAAAAEALLGVGSSLVAPDVLRAAVQAQAQAALESPLGDIFAQRAAGVLYGPSPPAAGASPLPADTARLARDLAAGVVGGVGLASQALGALGANAQAYARGIGGDAGDTTSGNAGVGLGGRYDNTAWGAQDDFVPSAEETEALVRARYAVRRNLLVRFTDDELDQSVPLGMLLRTRLTDPDTGIGGRIDLRSLPGTHVTPNLPSFKGIDWSLLDASRLGAGGWGAGGGRGFGLEGLRDAARAAAGEGATAARATAEALDFQQNAAVAVVVGFAEGEVKRVNERAGRH